MARIRLITRGDDAGCNESANRAVYEAATRGCLRNASILACGPAIESAAALLAGIEGLCCGVHLCFNAEWDSLRWGPVLPAREAPSLVDADGCFHQTTQTLHEAQPRVDEIIAECDAQLGRLRELGIDVRYADQHMGFGWVVDGLADAMSGWRARHGLLDGDRRGARLPQAECEGDAVDRLLASLSAADPGTYLMVNHPACDGPEMRALGHAGYPGEVVAAEREGDRRLWSDPRLLAVLAEGEVVAVRFDD
ncbi:MAG: ChbG/HpnK family deacetylase [Armatimonadetes bacterium]|nr:ChbG/HpnK family deacetylase [Armatimonadota bacterium]